MPKPLCPCCFQAYSASIISGETTTTTKQLLTTTDNDSAIRQSFYCGVCAPSDVERALAIKASLKKKKGDDDNSMSDDDVPPIVWYLTPEEIKAGTQQILKDTKNNLDSIAALSLDSVTFDNTILKLMTQPNYKTNPQVAACKFLQHCSTDPTLREAASKAGKDFASSRVQGRMRVDVYERVKAFSIKVLGDDEQQLNEYQKHFVKAVLEDFERAGLALSSENQNQLQLWLEEDSKVCSEYSQNLSTDETKLFFSPNELKGCTDDFIQERLVVSKDDDDEEEDGVTNEKRCTVTLKYPDTIPIGQTCEISETRRKVIEAREGPSIAYKNNLELVVRGITLRKKIATLLGYPSWAEYICTKRMSGSYNTVDKFLIDIENKIKEAGKDDYNTLFKLKKEHCKELGINFDDDDTEKLNAWDTSFYTNLLLKTKYGVDSESIKEYFPLDHVVETTLSIYQELLGLTFTELPKGTYWSWHTDVRCFKVKDTSSKEHIGHFYLDLHPRTGKYGHAAIFHLVKHNVNQGAVDCMLCNLPASTDDRPSLLRHGNVVTFFHEFGHIMHGLCSEGIGNSTRLAKCPRDFVEAPSQMLENWVWQPTILERLSKHYQTGKSLPNATLESMISAKYVNVAFSSLRQMYLSRLDLCIHGPNPPKNVEEIQALVDELRPSITMIENPPGNNMLRTFGHLMNQYSASYYGYLWAELISADMFATKFEKDNNIMNPVIGMEYRKCVLAPGGTGSITDHLTKFLGRPPNNQAFLKSRGILK